MAATIELQVDEAAAGERLDRFLAAPVGSRSRAQALIDAGAVTVDGEVRAKSHVVLAGQRVIVLEPELESPLVDDHAEQAPFEVRYEDDALLVVDKPAGVVVHPARGHWTGTLAQALAVRGAAGGEPWRAGIVHRLDRDTSGLLVVAKGEETLAELKRLLAARKLTREYLALVDGRPPARTGTIDAPLGRDRRNRVLHSIDTDRPREARTHYEIERLLPAASLLRVTLETGRTHQIRVHLATIGHPVCGDPAYGAGAGAGAGARYGLERQFLHAVRLRFPHPSGTGEVDVSSPLPEDLAAALERAERGAAATELP